jgi:thiamine phosphate synthase YjbQ (UPF0047 family)
MLATSNRRAMAAPATTFIYRHVKVRITTEQPVELIDITENLAALIDDVDLLDGFVSVQSPHVTTAVVLNEGDVLRIRPAASLEIADGRLKLGANERALLVESDGPRARDLTVILIGQATLEDTDEYEAAVQMDGMLQ